MAGLPLYAILFVSLLRRLVGRLPGPLALSRATALGLALPAVLLAGLARFGVSGGPALGLAVLAGCTFLALIAVPRGGSGSRRLPFLLTGWALAAAVVCPRPDIGPAAVARDGYAHLAWSRDLASAIDFYVGGLPAFLSTLGLPDALIGDFRVAPALLLLALFLALVAFGEQAGWGPAGLAGAAALVSIPALHGRLSPALPELMAYPLLVATWTEAGALARGRPGAIWWLGGLSMALVVVHVSMLEIVHFGILGLWLLLRPGADLRSRLIPLAAVGGGAGIGLVLSPALLSMVFGEGLLLVEEQPSALGPFSVKVFGAVLGPALDLALLALIAGLVLVRARWREILVGASPFLAAVLVLLSPMLLRSVGVTVPLQLFEHRQYAAAAFFTVLGWVFLLARIGAERPRAAAAIAVLPVAGVFVAFRGAPLALVLAGLAVLLAALVRRAEGWRPPGRATVLVGLLVLVVGARLVTWWPEDPRWLRELRRVPTRDTVLLTHWPAFNAAQARTGFRVEAGIAGRDAGLPLHALAELPPLREELTWAPGTTGADRTALRAWLAGRPEQQVLVLVHEDIAMAWEGYARTWERRIADGLTAGSGVYRAPPVDASPDERRALIDEALRSVGPVEVLFDQPEATLYRIRPADLRPDPTEPAG